MPMPEFDELPFNARPDLTPYLLHLTKRSTGKKNFSAYKNLRSILKKGEIWSSSSEKGFIKGPNEATCFMDVPFASLKYVLTPENRDADRPRYEPYGIAITKKYAYSNGCRPVLYLSNSEIDAMSIPRKELWRVVRFEKLDDDRWISWVHEREWRCKGDFEMPQFIQAAFVKNSREAYELSQEIMDDEKNFKCIPRSIIPMTLLCQGLLPKA